MRKQVKLTIIRKYRGANLPLTRVIDIEVDKTFKEQEVKDEARFKWLTQYFKNGGLAPPKSLDIAYKMGGFSSKSIKAEIL